MAQIETLARQAWQLREQGYAINDIANVMGRPTSAIERWIGCWLVIAGQAPPWHEGLNTHIVLYLKKAGITSREALVAAWENGDIKRGQSSEINVSRLVELRNWLEDSGSEVPEAPPRTMIIDLSPEAEVALNHLKRVTGQPASQLISRLLVEADELNRSD
ncbi:hypothetical protein [Halomonas daqiaonensis]|uniref:Uncharacterized protein n=1 Tax=Halomonas daqiaonensis TaxID=650850 RepID=A0A1H7UG77_9GAMM|nr:hypothetical protein [Halomonas daqiaonensis]SEL95247.1 hypothetical protein SAMN04488129_12030 [Halomonas daqiaonensis]